MCGPRGLVAGGGRGAGVCGGCWVGGGLGLVALRGRGPRGGRVRSRGRVGGWGQTGGRAGGWGRGVGGGQPRGRGLVASGRGRVGGWGVGGGRAAGCGGLVLVYPLVEGGVAVGVGGNGRVEVGAGCGYAGELGGGCVRVAQGLGARLPVAGGTGLLNATGCRPPRGPGVLLRSLWTRGGTSPQPGNTGPARARVGSARCLYPTVRELVGRSPSGCCASECPSHGVVLLDNAGAA